MKRLLLVVSSTRARGAAGVVVAVLRVLAGLVFLATGLSKLARPGAGAAQFVQFGLPSGLVLLVVFVGLVETVGGLFLVLGLLTRLTAIPLGGDMIVAVATAGVHVGGPVHLGLAPVLLVLQILFAIVGGGRFALDRRVGDRAALGSQVAA